MQTTIQTIYQDTGLTLKEQAERTERARSFYRRVNDLMTMSGCGVWLAIQSVTAADEETHDASTDR